MTSENQTKEFDKAISRWDISFDTTEDPVEFLERVEELADTLKVNKDKIIHVMPRCLQGQASLWYRNNKQDWKSWQDFIECFKLYYYPRNYEKNLLETIINRHQEAKESFVQYLTDIQTLIRRYGKLTTEQKLDRIYDNMRFNYKYYIRRKDFKTITELIQLAGDYENINANRDKENHEKPTCPLQRRHNQPSSKCEEKADKSSKAKSQAYTIHTQTEKDNRIFTEVKIHGKLFKALVDTGSTKTYINKEIMDQIKEYSQGIVNKKTTIKLADGSQITTDKAINLDLEVNGKVLSHQVVYLPSTTVMIMGMDLLKRLELTIGWKTSFEQAKRTRSKRKNTKADEASRNHVCTTTVEEKDWYTKKLAKVTKTPESQTDYCIRNGKLYRRIRNPRYGGYLDPSTEWKLCTKHSDKENILKYNHDEPNTEHLGTSKTFKKIAQRYYWPGIFRDVKKYVNRCETCQKHKSTQNKKLGLMYMKKRGRAVGGSHNRLHRPATTFLKGTPVDHRFSRQIHKMVRSKSLEDCNDERGSQRPKRMHFNKIWGNKNFVNRSTHDKQQDKSVQWNYHTDNQNGHRIHQKKRGKTPGHTLRSVHYKRVENTNTPKTRKYEE
ncbi:uncharacterized protein LOC123878875 [Maniola jurtina]|uniref:uncharacterized protein LOC123878875 n=1 Tax=Maniola jurtina TaxID=191418 RepID=UPI001E689059|nr:uncharacterized protein LOC123878875 [Maniola jurtina]